MSDESQNSISVTKVKLREVKIHLLQVKLLLRRHQRQIVSQSTAGRVARIIDGVDNLYSSVDGIGHSQGVQ
jgi:hypothetical protein